MSFEITGLVKFHSILCEGSETLKSCMPWLKSILKSRNQKPAEIRNHL